MLLFYLIKVVILMQTVSKTVFDFFIKYWLSAADKIVKLLLETVERTQVFVQT